MFSVHATFWARIWGSCIVEECKTLDDGKNPVMLYSFVALTMLTMAERYAQGIVWTDAPAADHAADLVRLKGMLSVWMKGEC